MQILLIVRGYDDYSAYLGTVTDGKHLNYLNIAALSKTRFDLSGSSVEAIWISKFIENSQNISEDTVFDLVKPTRIYDVWIG